MELTVAELAQRIGARLAGQGSAKIAGIRPIEAAQEDHVTFVSSEKYMGKLGISRAGAIIVAKPIQALDKPQLIVDNVDTALIAALETFAPELRPVTEGIDPTAKIGHGVRLAEGVSIGAGAVIDDGVEIGPSSVIGSGCKIGQDSKLGRNCRLDSNVVIYHNCRMGNNVVIQANSTVGSIGFGYFLVDGDHKLIPHNGGVVIEDFVEIGANCCIDRAKFDNTVIGAGTKIDNLVQIAHNVQIGKCCLIAGCVGIAGSCKIGDGVVLAGQVGVVDNVEIGDGTIVGARSLVTHNIPPGRQLFGTPATDKSEAFKIIGLTRRLPRLQEQLRELNSRVEKFEKTKARSRIRARLKWACIAAVVIIAGLLLLPYSRVILDPHECEVEHIVEEYQDGDDNFYVSANSHFEDLHTNKNLSIINDIMEAPEKIAADRADSKDSVFLICYKDLDRIKRTTAWKQLLFVKEIDVQGVYLVLLSTEAKLASAKVGSRGI